MRYALFIEAMELLLQGRTLKSGRISPYFFNSGLFNTGLALSNLVKMFVPLCRDVTDPVIFGPAYKGIPLASGVATELWNQLGINAGYAHNRKETKDHGEGGDLVGCPLNERDVIIVDDVITTNGSVTAAVDFVREYGGNVKLCVIAFDRQEKGVTGNLSAVQQFEKATKIPVFAGATLKDLIEVLEEDKGVAFPTGPQILPKIYEYQKQYGV